MKRLKPKECDQCGQLFRPRHPSSKQCSDPCRQLARAKKESIEKLFAEPFDREWLTLKERRELDELEYSTSKGVDIAWRRTAEKSRIAIANKYPPKKRRT